jgi:hypothetical protein
MAPVHGKISAAPVAPLPDLKVFPFTGQIDAPVIDRSWNLV